MQPVLRIEGLLRAPVTHQLDRLKQTASTHVADIRMAAKSLGEASRQVPALSHNIGEQAIAADPALVTTADGFVLLYTAIADGTGRRTIGRAEAGSTDASFTPETALLNAEGAKLTLLEQNFEFDLLTQEKLLEKSVGQTVKVIKSGELKRKVSLKGIGATVGAKAAIEAAGGKVEAVPAAE